MSVQALAWVLEHSPARGSDRLVLLSIANHAGKNPIDGAWEAWPGIETIQREAALERQRTVNDALARLIDTGGLEREINGAPDERIRKDRRPNLYRILLANGVTCGDTRCSWCGVTVGAERDDATRRDGVTDRDATGCRETSPEPLVNRDTEPTDQPSSVPTSATDIIDDLCIHLADAIETHAHVGRPTITTRWRRDMRLLVERGELGVDGARGHPPDVVARAIGFTFERLADPGPGGFCWADQVQSPNALRRHWAKLAAAKLRLEQGAGPSKGARTIDRVAKRLAEQQGQRPNLALLPPAQGEA